MTDQLNQQEELDLRSYLRPIWRRKWIILAIVVVATAATYFIAAGQPKSYVASATLYVQVADPTVDITTAGVQQSAPSSQSIADVAQLITAQSVTDRVARTLRVPSTSAASAVTATPATNSDFVTVTATSGSPVLAARLANTYVSAFLGSRSQAVAGEALQARRGAQATLRSLPPGPANVGQRQTLEQDIQTYQQIQLNPSSGARQIDTAAVPSLPTSPRPVRDAVFGGVVGLVLGLIAAFCLELLDRRLMRVSTLESLYDRPVLAVLPHVSDPAPVPTGDGAVVTPQFLEELRTLRVTLRLASGPRAPRTIMVTSSLPREGKSTITRDLALVYAEAGERVLVIDADLRRPRIERLFGLQEGRGLAHILRGEASLSETALPARLSSPVPDVSDNGHRQGSASDDPRARGSLDVLAHGERLENPLALLSSERMTALLEEAAQAYDVVLLDTAPVLTVADCLPLLEVVESVVLVVRLGQTTRESAKRFDDLITRLPDITFSGVIANDARNQADDEGYGSYGRYGYSYYQDKRVERKQKAGTTAS